jgi:hypothetical protein
VGGGWEVKDLTAQIGVIFNRQQPCGLGEEAIKSSRDHMVTGNEEVCTDVS